MADLPVASDFNGPTVTEAQFKTAMSLLLDNVASKNYADTKKTEAMTAAATDASTKAGTAETNAKGYTDSFDTLKLNAGKAYPLKQLTRNGTTSVPSDLNNALLDIKIIGAKEGKVYAVEYYANGLTGTAGIDPNGWRITEYDESVFPTSTNATSGTILIERSEAQQALDRTKISTVVLKPATRPEMSFSITVDGTRLKASTAGYILYQSSGGGYSWIIDKSCHVYRDSDLVSRVAAIAGTKTFFVANSPIFQSAFFEANKVFETIEFWGLQDGETVYLRTLWNYYYNSNTTLYYASVGFNSSLNQHITIGLAPQSNIASYAQFVIGAKLTGVVEYLLYRNGDSASTPIGRVRINWDEAKNSTSQRFIATDNSVPLAMSQVSNVASTQVLKIATSQPTPNPWLGKKIGAIGDSITWGFTPRNDPNGGTAGAQLQSWLVLAAAKLGMAAYNYGITGSTLGSNSAGANSPMTRRISAMDDSLDVICVMGGTNDVRKDVPLGTFTDSTDLTYYGALHVMCKGLIDKYYIKQGTTAGKTKQIVLMTPIKLQTGGGAMLDTALEPYVQAVKDVAAYYSIPVLDMYNRSGITPHISQTITGTATGYTSTYNVYITDGTHPTQQGHEKMANVAAGFIKSLA